MIGSGPADPRLTPATATAAGEAWWRSAVIYQVYPRSFLDASGDGVGDLRGVIEGLPALAELGADAVWLSPFMTSPQRDAGYDVADYCDVDPLFGTMTDYDQLVHRAHELGLRVIVDLVPNHTSSEHPWFRAAVAAHPGSVERKRYLFRDGRGEHGELPPNNWRSLFGGSAWTRITESDGTPGQWYLHLFEAAQPDLNWDSPTVRSDFRDILRFWLDRGTDGFRVDVAHGLIKADGLPDLAPGAADIAGLDSPYFGLDGVHRIYQDWHEVLAEYDGERVLAAEAWVEPLSLLARWVRPDEMHQAFNFSYLRAPWDAAALRAVIDESLAAFGAVGAPSTWVLSNHDAIRHTTRLSLAAESPHGDGIGPLSPGLPEPDVALRRGRAATALMLALPGSAYLYQGEELGLPEATGLPDGARQDPTWFRSGGTRYGRDGCRVPLPWSPDGETYGFSTTGRSWLPQPGDWARLARSAQRSVPGSTLELYQDLLTARREHGVAHADLFWREDLAPGLLGFQVADLMVVANTTAAPLPLPGHDGVVVSSDPAVTTGADQLPGDTTVWLLGAR